MAVMGVDLSTKSVCTVTLGWNEAIVDWRYVQLQGDLALERARNASKLLRHIPWEEPLIIAFERPAGKGTRAVMDMWRIQGVILALEDQYMQPLIEGETPIWELGPTEWKSICGLAGNAKKEDVLALAAAHFEVQSGVGKEWDEAFPDATQDMADAYCISLAALKTNQSGVRMVKHKRSLDS